jgi:MoaA/NifB/PqqE/SkfB family radical SAM enzyme
VDKNAHAPYRSFRSRLGPAGVHLFSRMSGLNVLLNEVKVPRQLWAQSPRQVSIALTNACDLECAYCFAPKHRAHARFEQVVGWLNELDANGTLGVGFGGGEPTLHPRFGDLCAHAARSTALAVTFTTHGHRLTEHLLAQLKGNVHFIRLSMDGVGSTYEKLRGRPFDTLRHTMNLIRNVAPFGINYVVNSDTINDLNAAIQIAVEAHASEMLLLPERRVGSRRGIDVQTLNKLRSWIDRYRNCIRLAISENAADGLPTCDALSSESGLRAYAHITADAVVKRTSFDARGVHISSDGLVPAFRQLSEETL